MAILYKTHLAREKKARAEARKKKLAQIKLQKIEDIKLAGFRPSETDPTKLVNGQDRLLTSMKARNEHYRVENLEDLEKLGNTTQDESDEELRKIALESLQIQYENVVEATKILNREYSLSSVIWKQTLRDKNEQLGKLLDYLSHTEALLIKYIKIFSKPRKT